MVKESLTDSSGHETLLALLSWELFTFAFTLYCSGGQGCFIFSRPCQSEVNTWLRKE